MAVWIGGKKGSNVGRRPAEFKPPFGVDPSGLRFKRAFDVRAVFPDLLVSVFR